APAPTVTTPAPTVTTPAPAPPPILTAPAPAPTVTTPTTTTTPASSAAPTTTTTTAAVIPGYTNSTSNYGVGKTVAYVIAPFAAVAAAYFFTHHHQVEIDPYAGFVWPPSVSFSDMATHLRDQPIYGVKASAYVTDNVQVEGNFG